MNLFALISLLSFVIAIMMSAFVLFQDVKSSKNKVFSVLAISCALQAFIEFGYRQSANFKEASFWWKIDIIWPFTLALMLHFLLVFANSEFVSNKKRMLSLLYFPAILFAALEFTPFGLSGPPEKQFWGWSYSATDSVVFGAISYVWIITLFTVAVKVTWKYGKRLPNESFDRQAVFVLLGIGFAIAGSIIENVLIFLNINFPSLITTSFMIFNALFGYAIWKHGMFVITPVTAAESIIATMADSLLLVDLNGQIISTNKAAQQMFHFNEFELIGQQMDSLFPINAKRPIWLKTLDKTKKIATFQSKDMETCFQTRENQSIPISLSGSLLKDSNGIPKGFLLIGRDISERKKTDLELKKHRTHLEDLVGERTFQLEKTNKKLEQEIIDRKIVEQENKDLEGQLHQSQKMDAIGRLAGGVAHDFNNLLFVINGCSASLLFSMDKDNPDREDVLEINEAGERAVELTKQLLAFSRKQIINPKIIDLNTEISKSQNMLARLIGENIQISFVPSEKLGKVKMDTSQVDQILLNLCVNARDSISDSGKLMITTSNVKLSKSDCAQHAERKEGSYIVLSVTDTGSGMSKEIVQKIFEPFFTTKSVGKGTGLGLSTVYGIVKQNGGFIEVKSTLSVGSEFRVFIPQVSVIAKQKKALKQVFVFGGKENVLLVEDNAQVRKLAKKQLIDLGYKVVGAENASKAITAFEAVNYSIDLLLTDIVMPQMSGKKLAETLILKKEKLNVLYMSGYNEEITGQHGVIQQDVAFIAKPFTKEELAHSIRKILDK